MKIIYFVILNYNTTIETKKCIESIRKLEGADFQKKVIVIDNCSTGNSFGELQKIYGSDTDISMYQMEKNIGFSRANNYGYDIVRKKGDADFCIVCNSDIVFFQPDFLIRLQREYAYSGFYICGPDVYCRARENFWFRGHQSPMYPIEWNKGYIKSYFWYNELMLKNLKGEGYGVFREAGVRLLWLWWKCIKKICIGTIYHSYRTKRHENIPVHGSCIVLSVRFLAEEEKLFLPETEFYGEELLLHLRSMRKGYKMVFNQEMIVEHLQGRATSTVINDKEGKEFCYRNYMMAARTYLEELGKHG